MNCKQSSFSNRINIFIKYLRERGGGEGVCYKFVQFLRRRDMDVHVYCGDNKLPSGHELDPIVHELGLIGLSRLTKYWSINIRARKNPPKGVNFSFDRIENMDIFRNGGGAHKSFMKKTLLGYTPFERMKKRVIRFLSPSNLYVSILEKRIFLDPNVASIIVNSRMAGEEITDVYPKAAGKLTVIQNGIDKSIFNFSATMAKRDRLKKKYRVEGKFTIGFAANNFERKGLQHLVKALRVMPEHSVLLVAGKGDIKPFAKEEFAHRIIYIGDVHSMAENFYPALDVFCLPSLYDPFAFVVAEALGMGIPSVTTRNNGSHEVIIPGRNGYLLENFSIGEVAEKIALAGRLPVRDYSDDILDEQEMYGRYLDSIVSVQRLKAATVASN